MAAKLKELVGGGTLVSDWDLTKHLLHNMWNYSDVSEVFTNHFRDAGVFETLQLILRDTAIRNHMGNDQVHVHQYNSQLLIYDYKIKTIHKLNNITGAIT